MYRNFCQKKDIIDIGEERVFGHSGDSSADGSPGVPAESVAGSVTEQNQPSNCTFFNILSGIIIF